MFRTGFLALAGLLLPFGGGFAQEPPAAPAKSLLDGASARNWSNLAAAASTGGTFRGETAYRCPDGPRGAYKHGFRVLNDSAADWSKLYGLRCQLELHDEREIEFVATIHPYGKGGVAGEGVRGTLRIKGKGPHTVTLPWSAFDFEQARTSFLQAVKGLTLTARVAEDGSPAGVVLCEVEVISAPSVTLGTPVRGQAAPVGGTVEYSVQVGNATGQPQAVALGFVRLGWQEMRPAVEPSALTLGPGEFRTCLVRVPVPERVPPGGHEDQELQAIANGEAATAARLTLTTASALPHPYLLHTPARWQEVREKVKNYPWAAEAQAELVKTADAWQPPDIARPPRNDPGDTFGPYLFATQTETGLLACGYAWQLTGNRAFAGKVATFLRRLSDPGEGYPKTLRACNQSLVQEGHFFQHITMSYDMILDAGLLNEADRAQIDATLRVFMETIDRESERASISNWNLAETVGAFYCALVMQDLAAADRFFAGPGGIGDQLTKGVMDDGWWYECSISYNMWCASEFTQAALAYAPFGYNFKDAWLPASYAPNVMLAAELNGGQTYGSDPAQRARPFGMDPTLYGPLKRPYRTITDLWNSLLPFIDYRGIMFGVNDSAETKVGGPRPEIGGAQPFELAYYAYRDPRYAALIKLGGGKRDLLYGVPELPEKTPEAFRDSAFADNVGLAMLRSQTPGRPVREQIQAALHYGTHGWAHGHFDRTDLLCLSRFGRNFWNPESVFWVYEPFMYKFYCQTSLNHNMAVVDQKMQEATPGRRVLWHTGKLMQAAAVETTARWSNPPYGGMVYDYVPVKTFAEKAMREGRSVPISANPPAYGTLTDYTEPIFQRRLMVVTDDYVVLADYLKGTQPHTFDSLLHLKGFQGLEAPGKTHLRHDAQWDADPVGSAQFVTDADWYAAQAPAVARFEEHWGPGADEAGSRSVGNEDGTLKLDVHSLWPPRQEVMVATAPEFIEVQKRLAYAVRGDGKTLAEGKTGAWILGEVNIDVPLDGVAQLELETGVEISKMPSAFWAGARIITRDGAEIPLSALAPAFINILQPKEPNEDYQGGPIKVAGIFYDVATPAQPQDEKQPSIVRVDLTGKNAARFKATLGSDFPPGPEAQRRKVYAVRAARGAEASFLTIIEPYEDQPMLKSAVALGADRLRVELRDGRTQDIIIGNFTDANGNPTVRITEQKDGATVREEASAQP